MNDSCDSKDGKVPLGVNCVEQYVLARDLPDEWDALSGDNYALKRGFLSQIEKGNPSDQRYYSFRDSSGSMDSILVTWVCRKCNVLMFTPLKFYVDVTFVHVPLSLARPGFVIGNKTKTAVEQFLKTLKGTVLIMNTEPTFCSEGFVAGATCSGITLHLHWESLVDYIECMRSNYRYRFKKALKKGETLRFRFLEDNQCFDSQLYSLYEQVYEKSKLKVEKLTAEFFRAPLSRILVCEKEGRRIGFIQMIENGEELVFAFVGLDYQWSSQFDTYINLLLKMIEFGIVNGFKKVDLGQTAEDVKLKLGGESRELHAHLHHSNPLVNRLLPRLKRFLFYQEPTLKFRVFREQ